MLLLLLLLHGCLCRLRLLLLLPLHGCHLVMGLLLLLLPLLLLPTLPVGSGLGCWVCQLLLLA